MLKVIIISRGIPTSDNPMNGIFEWDQAKALKNAGVEVISIALDLRSILRKRNLSSHIYEKDGIHIVYGSLPLGNIPAQVFYNLGRLKLRNLLKLAITEFGKPDIIHGHFTDIGAIAAAESKRLNIPYVLTEHSSSLNLDELSPKTIFMAKRGYSDATELIAVSDKLKNRIKQHFNKTSTVIPNVVDTESIAFNNINPNIDRDKILFVSTGNLLTRKGYDLLLNSFSQIPKDMANLIIIGEGAERENLTRQIRQYNLEDSVTLAGFKTRNEISELYSKADCFVLASRRETFGVVYIEAMLAGLPVIATRCGGPEDFVNNDNGILIDTENTDQLYKAFLQMISSARSYSSQSIHDFAVNSFSPKVIAEKLISTYKSIL